MLYISLGFIFCRADGLGGMWLVPVSALLAPLDPVPPLAPLDPVAPLALLDPLDPLDPVPPLDPVAPCAAAIIGPAATAAISADILTARPAFFVNIGSP
jgi:hypothetical protein